MRECPFCRKADDQATIKGPPMGGYGDEPEIYQVRCAWCGARSGEASTEEKAIEAWEERK